MNDSLYKETATAKDSSLVPITKSGRPVNSKYNPKLEAERTVEALQGECFLFAGIGAGFQILSCRKKYPGARIFALELNKESLSFCLSLPQLKEAQNDREIIFCTEETLYTTLLEKYIPTIHGTLAISFNRTWENEIGKSSEKIRAAIKEAINAISADFSVQSHFGKIWQHNILNNVRFITKTVPLFVEEAELEKTAAVIAAGPTLDVTINVLKENREKYFIISSDTAYGTLISNKIIPDAVISVDAQRVSGTHFYGIKNNSSTLFILDICSPTQLVSDCIRYEKKTCFIQTGHPLSTLLTTGTYIPLVDSGSGTVAVAACDTARLLGFKRIALFGSDFCYNSGKAYALGTYLEKNLSLTQSRTQTYETAFASLMFRTELKKMEEKPTFSPEAKNPFSTEILERYRNGLLAWAEKNGFEKEGSILTKRINSSHTVIEKSLQNTKTLTEIFVKKLSYQIENEQIGDEVIAILPYIAWLKKHEESKEKQSFFALVKLAYSKILRYNMTL